MVTCGLSEFELPFQESDLVGRWVVTQLFQKDQAVSPSTCHWNQVKVFLIASPLFE